MLERTPVFKMLQKASLISHEEAWVEAFTDKNNIKQRIIELIEQDQLYEQGIDGNNSIIGYYSPATEVISGGKKKAGEHYTLFNIGDFYKSVLIQVFATELIVSGNSRKFENKVWFRDEILKLTDDNLVIIIGLVHEKYIKYARKILFGN